MHVPNKIGFHSGPTGNMDGIGEYWRKLSTAGIPIFHKAADGYDSLYEIIELVPNPHQVEHHLVYRMSTRGQDEDYDVPPYDKPPHQPRQPAVEPEVASEPEEVAEKRPSAKPNAQFVRDVTVPDDTPFAVGASFTKTWRVRNNGNVAWQPSYRLVHVGGVALTETTSQPVPVIQPGQEADIAISMTVPAKPATYISDWRFQDDNGRFFGDNIFARIVAEPVSAQISDSKFVADVNIPDDTVMEPGQRFTKTWRLRNNGRRAWGSNFTVNFLQGVAMSHATSQPIPPTAPGATVDISLSMTAPVEEAPYYSEWMLKDDQGNFFGDNFYTRIVVKKKHQAKPRVALQSGVNINPDAPHSNPVTGDELQGTDWVRFVFKLAAREDAAERHDIHFAFAQYDSLIRQYQNKGIKSLIVLNQETVWGNAPWTGNNDWLAYSHELARVARQIATRYQIYGEKVAYEIWNEGDLLNNPASVYVAPEHFALLLQTVAEAIRSASPRSPLILGGLATGPERSIDYLQRCLEALGGTWPVDAIGIHPYGRWATRAPFDWGKQFGTLADALAQYQKHFPQTPFWITEIGVAADNEIGPEHYREVANYLTDVYQHIAAHHTHIVPVVIWFAWSDWMRNAGIVGRDGSHKAHVYDAFQTIIKNKDKLI